MNMTELEYNLGAQPLDRIMTDAGMTNHQVVAASSAFLTHKVVNKARKGRRLTRRTQEKVRTAVNLIAGERTYAREDLFNYDGS